MDLANWMGQLPELKTTSKFLSLKIPGSHDSFSFSLDFKYPLSQAVPSIAWKLRKLPCTKQIVYNWSLTEKKNATDQLNAGIRYFDVRTGYYDGDSTFHAMHGMYGAPTQSILTQINKWLSSHPKEVIVLHFQHFHFITTDSQWDTLGQMIVDVFGTKLCPPQDPQTVTLQSMWTKGHQIILVWDASYPKFFDKYFWKSSTLQNPWANTDLVTDLLPYLQKVLQSKPDDIFFVTQGVLTPQTHDVVLHLTSTLEKVLAEPATKAVEKWLPTLPTEVKQKNNIVMVGFADEAFATEVVKLNL